MPKPPSKKKSPRDVPPLLFLFCCPMAWGKDTVLTRLRREYGYRDGGTYPPTLPGQRYKKGKLKGQLIEIPLQKRWIVPGTVRDLILLSKNDDWKHGMPDALLEVYQSELSSGNHVLDQARLFGPAMTESYAKRLINVVRLEKLVWLYTRVDDPTPLVQRMSSRGGRSLDDCQKTWDTWSGHWRRAYKLVDEMIRDGAQGTKLPVGTEDEQYQAVVGALRSRGVLGWPPKRPEYPPDQKPEGRPKARGGRRSRGEAPRPARRSPRGLRGASSGSLEARFNDLTQRAQSCRRCPRMRGMRRCLSRLNGDLTSKVVFVGEAPGRAGAGRHGVPLGGVGASGENFKMMLKTYGLTRGQVFVTNAVLCNPQDSEGKNRPPTELELKCCAAHLRETLEILNPPIVASMGKVALEALRRLNPHGLYLPRDAGKSQSWWGRTLFALYHPSPLAFRFRDFTQQEADLGKVIDALRALGSGNKAKIRTVVEAPSDAPGPREGEGSGAYIRRLWMTGAYTPDQLVALVHRHWDGRKTTVRDVYYNYRRLLKLGVENVPPWRR